MVPAENKAKRLSSVHHTTKTIHHQKTIQANWAQIRAADLFIFFRNLALLVTRYHGQLSCTISEKTYDPILRKFCDGWSDKRTEKDRLARVIS